LADEPSSLADGQTLDSVRETSPVTSFTTTQAVDIPEGQDSGSLLDTSGGSDVAVAEQLAVSPHPEQVDGPLSGPFEIPGPTVGQNELTVSAPPSEEGPFVVSPSSSAPAMPDSSVIASSSSSDTSVAAPPTESAAPDEEQPADNTHSPDVPAPNAPEGSTTSSASVIECSPTQRDRGDPRATGVDDIQDDSATQPEVHFNGPASSDTSTLVSTSSASIYSEASRRLPAKAESQSSICTPSANRLSISYAAGTRRLVINAEIVEKLKIHRSDGRVEITLRIEKDEVNELNGIIVGSFTSQTPCKLTSRQIEGLSEATKSYSSLDILSPTVELDPTVPPFSKANVPSEVTLLVHLDRARPLSEPKWVKSGDVQEWLKSMFGRMIWLPGDVAGGWEKKVEVVDPDPVSFYLCCRFRKAWSSDETLCRRPRSGLY
jgi:20S proteasome subunit alpha 6